MAPWFVNKSFPGPTMTGLGSLSFFGGGNINVAAKDFSKIMSERMQNMWTSEYRIFEDNFKIFPWLKYKPIQSNLDDAKQVLGRYAAQNGVRLTDQQLDEMLLLKR